MSSVRSTKPVLAIIGPSGAGKSTIVRDLLQKGLLDVTVTWTDRPMRPNEESAEHHFVSPEEFTKQIENDYFVHEPLTFFGLPYRYALPPVHFDDQTKIPTIMVRANVMDLVKSYYPGVVTYQIEASREFVQSKLAERQEHGDALGSRLVDYDAEVKLGARYASRRFTNIDLDTTLKEIEQALRTDFEIAYD